MTYILALDQGTTSTRALVFSSSGEVITQSQAPFQQTYPQSGWVEQSAAHIWETTHQVIASVIKTLGDEAVQIRAMGITNQRETSLVWDKVTGEVLHPAISWQDSRTQAYMDRLSSTQQAMVCDKTGLCCDPYFSATKFRWILDALAASHPTVDPDRLALGTIDSFLIWKLTDGKVHATDATNASRTLLFNIHSQTWDQALLDLFQIPPVCLPTVLDSTGHFGEVLLPGLPHAIPISGVAGDQQAALIGQGGISEGAMKCTFGTGAFVLQHTGDVAVKTEDLITTVAYRDAGKPYYAIEGSNFNAGSAIQFCRDQLNAFSDPNDTATIAAALSDNGGVYFVPAFTGLGAPYWAPDAKGAILGLTRDSTLNHIVRAALEAAAYQTVGLVRLIEKESHTTISHLCVDGGMTQNPWLLQFLADTLQCNVVPAALTETTALGAALLAGVGAGIYEDLVAAVAHVKHKSAILPQGTQDEADERYAGWLSAVDQVV